MELEGHYPSRSHKYKAINGYGIMKFYNIGTFITKILIRQNDLNSTSHKDAGPANTIAQLTYKILAMQFL